MGNEHRAYAVLSGRRDPVEFTNREYEIALLICEGEPNKACAFHLKISEKTVEAHRTNIYRKLDVHNTAMLVRKMIARGYLQIENENPNGVIEHRFPEKVPVPGA